MLIPQIVTAPRVLLVIFGILSGRRLGEVGGLKPASYDSQMEHVEQAVGQLIIASAAALLVLRWPNTRFVQSRCL
jgi:hypothetical protein